MPAEIVVHKLIVALLCGFWVVAVGAITLKSLRDGEFGTKGGTVSRQEAPFRFWFTNILLASSVIAVLTGGIGYVLH